LILLTFSGFLVVQVINNFATLAGFGFRFFGSDFTGSILGDNRLKFDFCFGFAEQIRGLFLLFAKGERGLFTAVGSRAFFLVALLRSAIFWGFFSGFRPF